MYKMNDNIRRRSHPSQAHEKHEQFVPSYDNYGKYNYIDTY